MYGGAVKIENKSDYISPAQACVVSLSGGKIDTKNDEESGLVQIHPRASLPPTRADPSTGAAVKVTLYDCLACSGCITSAEAVLLEQQSVAECLQRLADPSLAVAVTLSPQTRASLAAALNCAPRDAHMRVAALFRGLGAAVFLDATIAREVSLLECGAEFVHRLRANRAAAAAGVSAAGAHAAAAGAAAAAPLPVLASACPGWVCYAEKSGGSEAVARLSAARSPQAVAAVIAKRLWPEIASVGGPDQGPLAGARLAEGYLRDGRRVFHVALMPCFDKKLEASREELSMPDGSRETDLVLTTGEVLELAAAAGADLRRAAADVLPPRLGPPLLGAEQAPPGGFWGESPGRAQRQPTPPPSPQHSQQGGPQQAVGVVAGAEAGAQGVSRWRVEAPLLDAMVTAISADGELWGAPGDGGSGGYAEAVAEMAAAAFGAERGALPLRWAPRPGPGGSDFREATLAVGGGQEGGVTLRFAQVYGFRNIQALMRQIKRGSCQYDYVEVMACPGGCLNGGGQLKPAAAGAAIAAAAGAAGAGLGPTGAAGDGEGPKALLGRVAALYGEARARALGAPQPPLVRSLYEWVGGGRGRRRRGGRCTRRSSSARRRRWRPWRTGRERGGGLV